MSSHMPRALSALLAAALVAPIAVSSAVATTESPTPPENPSVTETPSPEPTGESTPTPETSEPTPSSEQDETEGNEDPTGEPSEDETESVDDNDTDNQTDADDSNDDDNGEGLEANTLMAPMQEDAESTLTLLNINDFHGRVDHQVGMSLAATVEAERAENENNLFLSAGDDIGASLFVSSVQQDEPTIDYLNTLGLEASALGNHEFDRGVDDLTGRVTGLAAFDHIAANVVDENGDTIVDPYTEIETPEGQTVAVIGAVTQETPTLVDPSGVQGLDFTDPVAAVNEQAELLAEDEDIDVIVAEYHDHTDEIVTETHPAVDVIFTGHTHEEYVLDANVPGEEGETRPVLQTGEYGNNLGRVELELDADDNVVGYSHELVETSEPSEEEIAANPTLVEIQQILDDAAEVAEEEGSQVLATLEDYVTTGYRYGEDEETGEVGHNFDQRDLESSMGHLVADAWLWAGNNNPAGISADIGLVNSGGLRDEFPGGLRQDIETEIGDITVADAVGVNPFANDIFTTDITGAQLRETLEQQWQTAADGSVPGRPYLQLGLSSNVTYTYTGDIGMAGHETLGNNIDEIWVNGNLVQDEDEFTVALPSFLAAGGDNFRALGNGTNDQQTALIDTDAFTNYLQDELDSAVAPRFDKQAVQVSGLEDSYDVDGNFTAELSGFQLQSYGAPELDGEQLSVSLVADNPGTVDAGTVEIADNTASLDIDLSALDVEAGNYTLVVTHEATGTEVRSALELTGQQTSGDETPTPEETPTPSPTGDAHGNGGDDTSTGGGTAGDDMTRTGGLADTGAEISALVIGGLLAVGVGTALMIARRKAAH
ncbi:hypothetical protein GCM10009720_04140 [Yaniella flava]|uniref:5'-nucleotidase n=1 Tax=Yaniella flava TaxID=287930 RepID=A0ABN2U4A5_9MICC